MANYNTVITNEGAALLALVIANQGTLTLTEMRFSTNDYSGSEATLTYGTFSGVFITAAAAGSVVDSTTIKAASQFDNSSLVGDNPLYSIGLVGTDGNTTALIAVSTTTAPDIIRPAVTGVSTYAFNMNLTVSSTNNITVVGTTAAVLYDVDVVDTLISIATDKPLSANMGRVLGENVEAIVDVYGSKNLNAFPYYDGTYKSMLGVVYSVDSDGVVSLANTATGASEFICHDTDLFLKSGTYILTGCPAGGNTSNTYFLYTQQTDSGGNSKIYRDTGNGVVVTVEPDQNHTDGAIVSIVFHVFNGCNVSSKKVYPMLRDARITDPTYEPYAKTNQQLTVDKAERSDLATLNLTGSTNSTGSTIKSGTFFYLNGSYCRAIADIANGTTFALNSNFKVDTVGDELTGETGTFTLTFAAGTYTDGFSAQTNYYKRIGGLVIIRGELTLTGTPDASHSYVSCYGLPFPAKRYDIPTCGTARVPNTGKIGAVRLSSYNQLLLYFDLADGTFPTAGQVYDYTIIYEC